MRMDKNAKSDEMHMSVSQGKLKPEPVTDAEATLFDDINNGCI
jgi:hypothetical protein